VAGCACSSDGTLRTYLKCTPVQLLSTAAHVMFDGCSRDVRRVDVRVHRVSQGTLMQ
jgi:hypothetical protein